MTTMRPEFVAPAVALMVSEQTSLNGQVIIAGRGVFRRAANVEGRAALCGTDRRDARSAGSRRRATARHARCDRVLPMRWQRSSSCSASRPERSDASTRRCDRRPIGLARPARAWWTVAVLTFTYIVSFVDRTILGLLIEPIKADLSLNDTQIGLVQAWRSACSTRPWACRWAGSRIALRVAV